MVPLPGRALTRPDLAHRRPRHTRDLPGHLAALCAATDQPNCDHPRSPAPRAPGSTRAEASLTSTAPVQVSEMPQAMR